MPDETKELDRPFSDPQEEERELYAFTEEERNFVSDVYQKMFDCYQLRHERLELLGNRTLHEFWDDSERDYGVVMNELEDENDPVKQYQSTTSRDKANVFIANWTSKLMYPDVIAQHEGQSIDRVMSRVGSSLLYWAHRHDGWPSETGQQKNNRMVHTGVITGTAFCLDIVTKDGLESEFIPNEELYIPTFWQPNLQKMPYIFRTKLNILYEEAEAMFGHLDNWKYVYPGSWSNDFWASQPELKRNWEGIIKYDQCTVVYVWRMARPQQLVELKKMGKVTKDATRACFYNVIVNGIPMFPIDNVSPYKHGFYPLSKLIFEKFARADFFYGNSIPNKMREDKKWRDNWKTLLRFKGKLGAGPPTLVIGGNIDEQVVLPFAQTSVSEGIEVQAVPGVTGISNADIQLLQMVDSEIDKSTVSPSAAGQRPDARQTARAEVIQAAASEKMMEPFSQELAFFMQSRSFHILMSLFQYLPKRDIKKIAVPDQTLQDGIKGTFEILFVDYGELDKLQALQESFAVRSAEQKSRKEGKPRDIVFVKPDYIRELKYYLFSDPTTGMQDKSLLRMADFQKDLQLFLSRPDLFVTKEVVQEYIQMKGYPQRILASESPSSMGQGVAAMMGGQPPSGGPMPPGPTPNGPMTGGEQMANAASEKTAGAPMPALPPA